MRPLIGWEVTELGFDKSDRMRTRYRASTGHVHQRILAKSDRLLVVVNLPTGDGEPEVVATSKYENSAAHRTVDESAMVGAGKGGKASLFDQENEMLVT